MESITDGIIIRLDEQKHDVKQKLNQVSKIIIGLDDTEGDKILRITSNFR